MLEKSRFGIQSCEIFEFLWTLEINDVDLMCWLNETRFKAVN